MIRARSLSLIHIYNPPALDFRALAECFASQEVAGSSHPGRPPGAEDHKDADIHPEPVSYTHLDVYKRQPYEQINLYVHKVNKNYQKYLALYAQDEGV